VHKALELKLEIIRTLPALFCFPLQTWLFLVCIDRNGPNPLV